MRWPGALQAMNKPTTIEQEMHDAAAIRDRASRVITGAEYALVAWVADGAHRNSQGEWRAELDRTRFNELRERLAIYLEPANA